MQNYRSKGPDFPQEILKYMKVFAFPLEQLYERNVQSDEEYCDYFRK